MTGQNLHIMYGCLIILLSLNFGCAMPFHSSMGVKGAYWRSWAESDFPPSSIDTTLFTHIYYAFLVPDNTTFRFDVDEATAKQLIRFTSTLRSKTPPAKTLFSVGGGGVDGSLFSNMASSAATRKSFIDSSVQVARKYGFDGIDLDWEMPQNPTEMDYFGLLLGDWRAAVQKEARATRRPQLLLTAATYFSVDFFLAKVYRAYPVASINKNLDWINAMCYDYHGSWDTSATGAQAALFDPKSNITTHYGLGRWIKAGLLRNKLNMGLPLYGRTWKLKDSSSTGVGAPAVDVGPGDGGTMTFKEIEAFNKENNATVVYDAATVSVYSVAGTSWIGYDDPRSIFVKVKYAKALKLRGYFFWAVNGDNQWKLSRQAKQSWGFL